MIQLVNEDALASTNSKIVIETMFTSQETPDEIIDRLGLRQKNDTKALEKIVDQVLADSPAQIADYKSGKVNIFGFFVGQCMKLSKGQGNPKIFTDILQKKLSE